MIAKLKGEGERNYRENPWDREEKKTAGERNQCFTIYSSHGFL